MHALAHLLLHMPTQMDSTGIPTALEAKILLICHYSLALGLEDELQLLRSEEQCIERQNENCLHLQSAAISILEKESGQAEGGKEGGLTILMGVAEPPRKPSLLVSCRCTSVQPSAYTAGNLRSSFFFKAGSKQRRNNRNRGREYKGR